MKKKLNSMAKVKAPTGYFFKIKCFKYHKEINPHTVYIQLHDAKTKFYVGRVSLARETGSYRTHSTLNHELRAKG